MRPLLIVLLLSGVPTFADSRPRLEDRSVTVREGTELVASLSPDGKRVAFILFNQVWLVDRQGGRASPLTDVVRDPHEAWALAWAPDSRRLALVTGEPNWGLQVIDVESRRAMPVPGLDSKRFYDPVWPPGANGITGSAIGAEWLGFQNISLGVSHKLVPVFKPSRRAGTPSYSPDGRHLAYAGPISDSIEPPGRPNSRSDLWEADLAKGTERRLTEDSALDAWPAYSPDGHWLAFLSERSGSRQVWIVSRGGGEARPLTRDAQETQLGPLSWLPDGRGVVYTRAGQIRIAWLDGAPESTIEFTAELPVRRWHRNRPVPLPQPGRRRIVRGIFTPALSPDGKRVAFAALGDLWIARVDGGKATRLTRTAAEEHYPRWSPDGRQLAYVCEAPGRDRELRLLEIERPEVWRTALIADTTEYLWSPDGMRLAYFDTGKISWIDLKTGDKHEVTKTKETAWEVHLLGWSAKDNSIVFSATAEGRFPVSRTERWLWRVPADGGAAVEWNLPERYSLRAAWSADLSRVTYSLNGVGYHVTLAEAGKPLRIPDPAPRFCSWSADARRLLYLSGPRVRLLDVERGTARTLEFAPEYVTAPPASPSLLVRNVHAIDGTGAPPSALSDILVSGGRIRRIAPAGRAAAPAGAREIDAAGRSVLPGLFNVHTHAHPTAAFIYNGVLAIRDVGKDAEWAQSQRERIEAGELLAPRMFMTGGLVVPESGYGLTNQRAVDPRDGKSVRDEVAALAALGADWIKPYFPNPLLDARVIETAHTFGLPVTSHNFFLGSLARGLSGKEHVTHYYRQWTDSYREDFLSALRAADVCVTPTLVTRAVHRLGGRSQFISMDERLFDDPALTVFWPQSVLQRAREAMRRPIPETRLAQLQAEERRDLEDARRLWKAGVRIATGTDIPRPWDEFGLHLEMELLVKAGMTPLEAIRSATLEGARYLGVERDLGSVEVGKAADLIIVDGNPALDIRDTRRIVWVVVGGRAYARQEIVDTVRQGVR